jgi:peptidoglycan/LPS O-acetylase OafA/YrhL
VDVPINSNIAPIGAFFRSCDAVISLIRKQNFSIMTMLSIQRAERQYFIDWLRILLILSVFLYHIGMFFNSWDWHVKNPIQYDGILRYTMIFLSRWRMPLLFLISGAGTYYAMGKRTPSRYLGERFKRLMIPFFAGIFILVPVQVYLEKSAQYSSLLSFYPHMFDGIYPTGNFSWHHLWFILYLFVISLFFAPFMNMFRSNGYLRFSIRLERMAEKPFALNIIAVILIISQLLLRPWFPEDTHALFNDWAAFAYFVIFFLAGFILLSNRNIIESVRKQKNLYLGEGIIATVGMFSSSHLFADESVADLVWGISSIILAWSCGLAAIGYAKQYLNRDTRFRKLANEAIYPFYLLHQPVILIMGSFLIKIEMPDLIRFIFLITSSFGITCSLYWFVVRPFHITRVVFGMKPVPRRKMEPAAEDSLELIPEVILVKGKK